MNENHHLNSKAENKKCATVYLVGAGPGDVGLFTLRGKELLQQADTVIYDALVGNDVLSLIPAGTETVYVGKRNHHHTMKQDEICKLLVEKARAGKMCVRLKGGDPYLFGRGGEEAQFLRQEGVPFEVVSGVSSAFAVPASAGIPLTHRELSSSVHIITGHRVALRDTEDESTIENNASVCRDSGEMKYEKSRINYDALVQAGGTCVFLMGLTVLPDIVKGLLRAGMRRDMPVAVISNGTTAAARKTVATLASIEEMAAGMQAPAIIVVGDVCALSKELDTSLSKKLFGKRVIICSSGRKKGYIAQALRDNGAEVIEKQMITMREKKDKEPLHRAIAEVRSYQWLVFTSPEGVNIFFNELRAMEKDIRELAGIHVAAIGEKTAAEIREKGLKVDLMPEVHEGGAFGKELAKVIGEGEHVLIPRAEQGGKSLVQEISRVEGVEISDLSIYETTLCTESDENLQRLLTDDAETMLVFTSASTVKSFLAVTDSIHHYNHCRCVCIGNQTKRVAMELKLPCFVSKEASMESLLELILKDETWSLAEDSVVFETKL